jgi:hypothetical protein
LNNVMQHYSQPRPADDLLQRATSLIVSEAGNLQEDHLPERRQRKTTVTIPTTVKHLSEAIEHHRSQPIMSNKRKGKADKRSGIPPPPPSYQSSEASFSEGEEDASLGLESASVLSLDMAQAGTGHSPHDSSMSSQPLSE